MVDENEKSLGQTEDYYQVSYFKTDEMLYLVAGDEVSTGDLLGWANKLAKGKAKISIDPEHVLKFPPVPIGYPDNQQTKNAQVKSAKPKPVARPARVDRGPFALVPATVTWDFKNENLTDNEWEWKKARALLELIFLLDKNRKKAPGGTLQSVSPNWLTSGSPAPGGTGGPGGMPMPYMGEPDNEDYCFQFPTVSKTFLQQIQAGTGDGVVVAILDTAPDSDSLASIYDEWVTRDGRNHRLIRTLLDPTVDPVDRLPRLTVYRSSELESDPILQEMKTLGYDYDMTDHGLFVAGIIHSLAPQAKIHLFQVLNRFGVGDLRVIARGLQEVINKFQGKPLVVNLSLTLNIPLEKGHTLRHSKNDPLGKLILRRKPWWIIRFICMIIQWILGWILGRPVQLCNKSWFDRQAWAAEWISDSVNTLGSRIIAAAGNNYDKDKHTHRPQACYPAAFENVLGVGALPKSMTPPPVSERLKTASYSNLSDVPPSQGVSTLGGEEGKEKGVLGIYVGQFPPTDCDPTPPPNTSGWAWWCGTSFAAPIISGVMAALISGMTVAGAQDPKEAVYRAEERWTENIEDVLFVTQGKP
jgi:hypothetical protein